MGDGRFRAPDGSDSQPSIGFASDLDTGLKRTATNSIGFVTGGTHRMNLDSSGNLVATGNVTAFGSPSDIRLKKDVQRITDPIGKVQKLDGISFAYKKTGARSTGLIAQQLIKVLPEVVYQETDLETGEKHYAVRYGQVVGLLVEAIKDQQDQLNLLTEKIEELLNGNYKHN